MNRFAFLISAFALVACNDSRGARDWRPTDHAQPPDIGATPAPARPVSPDEARAQAGAALFRMQCAACHGARGLGDGPAARGVVPPNLTTAELQDRVQDADIATIIRDGRGAMPGFGSTIDESGIAALVVHVRSLRAAEPPAAQ